MNRLSAFLIHLGISLIVFVFLAYLVVFIWYPGFFFDSDGGWQGIRIIVAVDLILGPTLTLIVYQHGKPGLKFDLSCIAAFQAACLAAGTFVVYAERPLALVYVDGQFFSMSSDAYEEVGAMVPDLSALPGNSPKKLFVKLPEDLTAQSDIRRRALQQRQPLRTFSALYSPFDAREIDVEKEAFPYSVLIDRDQKTKNIPLWLSEHGGQLEDYAFFPFATRYEYIFLGVDKRKGQLVGVLKTPAPVVAGKPS
ncbi:MAG: hypothetical protein O7E57_13615 [Gammaproteobacteria bacterium]|nr:hypothetical protein [Gammaproteobacteria bacterium]